MDRSGATETALEIYCLPRSHRIRSLYRYLTGIASHGDVAEFFMDTVFMRRLETYLTDYVSATLYNMGGMPCLSRIRRFIEEKPVVAQYICKTNLGTVEARGILASVLDVSNRNRRGFKQTATVEDLRAFVSSRERARIGQQSKK